MSTSGLRLPVISAKSVIERGSAPKRQLVSTVTGYFEGPQPKCV
jgi:hypothetical protein